MPQTRTADASVKAGTLDAIVQMLDDVCFELHADYGVELTIAAECCWACEVRVTDQPNAAGPDRSFVTFAGGGIDPEDAAERAVTEALGWLAERRTARKATE